MKKIITYLQVTVVFIYVCTFYLAGYLLHTLSCIIRIVALLLMLSPRAAKEGKEYMFRAYWEDIVIRLWNK